MSRRKMFIPEIRLVLTLAVALFIAACGVPRPVAQVPAATTVPTESTAPTAAPATTEAPAETVAAAGGTLKVAYASDLDPADVADQIGFGIVKDKYGIDLEVTQLTEDAAVVAGLLRGDIGIGNLDVTAAIKAAQVGVPLRVLIPANMAVEFVLIGQPGIKTVQDLKGKKVAFHGPGSGTEILPRMLVEKADGIEQSDVEWIVLPESPNRAAAMEANRIDVTALEFADVVTLQEAGKAYEIIASFYDVAPEAIATTWAVTDDYLKANGPLIEQFVAGMAEGYSTAYTDRDAWMSSAKGILDVNEARLGKTYDFYKSINMFPKAPFYTAEVWDKMNTFYTGAGEYEDPATWDMVVPVAPAAQ
jgi:NitT/TauT family transport system substrate-binding protein